MSRRTTGKGEWDDPWPSDDADDDEPTVPCPYCQGEVHEDSQRCPYCERYISREDAPPGPKPWWLIAGVVVCLLVVGLWILGR
jgi:hypothetical protein